MNAAPIRILYLAAEPWPTHRSDVAALFGKYLPRHGIQTDLVTGAAKDAAPPPWPGGDMLFCRLVDGPGWRHWQRLLHGVRVLIGAEASVYDAIQVRDMPVIGAIGLLIARAKKIPFFYWVSYPVSEAQLALASERGLSQGVLKFLFPLVRGHTGRFLFDRLIARYSDHLFAQSVTMKEQWAARGISRHLVTPVPMGVDMEEFCAVEISSPVDDRIRNRKAIVYLGILDRARRIEILFEMLRLVIDTEPTAILVLVGDAEEPAYRQWLEERAKVTGVSKHILWTGWLPRLDAWQYVRAARVAVSPIPRGDLLDGSSPTKILEYLLLRVPFVCNDNPDQKMVVEQTGAGRCVPYQPETFAAAVLEILKPVDGARGEMTEKVQRYIDRERDYRQIASELSSVYRRLLNSTDHRDGHGTS